MSNNTSKCESSDPCVEHPCEQVELVIHPREKDLGGFSVRRVLPYRKRRMVGPWLFFDHMGPAEFAAGEGINVRPHPHINLATVTYLFEGEILHRDSLGFEQAIRPGDINLMVAGRGITHSERETEAVHSRAHRLHGLQLWMALPESDEETDPAFYHYPAEAIPTAEIDGVPLRVMIGSAYGLQSPVKTFAETLYVEASMAAGQTLELPRAEELAVYVAGGEIELDSVTLGAYQMAVLNPACIPRLVAKQPSQIAIIGGERMSPRFMYWNFVSSRQERIEQAKAEWREGRFAKVVGDEAEWIPLPE